MKLPLMAELRKQKNLKQQNVADAIGEEKRTYAAWERGENNIPLDALVKIADFYGVPTDYLLGHDLHTDIAALSEDKKYIADTLPKLNEQQAKVIRDMLDQMEIK